MRGRPDDQAYGEFISETDLQAVTGLSTRMNDAVKAVRGDDYGVEQAYGLYPTSGASDDYTFSRSVVDPTKTKVYAFTIECGHTFQPTSTEAEHVIREVSAGLLALTVAATENIQQAPAAPHVSAVGTSRQTAG